MNKNSLFLPDNVYFIGGSPCSGKSTSAELLSKRFHMTYFKVDESLGRYLSLAAENGSAACRRIASMTGDEIWMRTPEVQCDEEFEIYRDIAPFVLEDIKALGSDRKIIAEGAAYIPAIAFETGAEKSKYMALVPEREFQFSRYIRRPWVGIVLKDCTDKQAAFRNWMERDALFAEVVLDDCRKYGYFSMVNDGSRSPAEIAEDIARHFGLAEKTEP